MGVDWFTGSILHSLLATALRTEQVMDDNEVPYAQQEVNAMGVGLERAFSPKEISVEQRVATQIKIHEQHLENLKKINILLQENPTISELLTLMRRAGI